VSAVRRDPPIELAVAASALVGAGIALAVQVAGPAEGLSVLDAAGAIGVGLLLAVAALVPRLGLTMTLAYVASPLSFYILFRNTDFVSPYPASSDLALDAAITLGLAGAALVGAAARSWASGGPLLPALPARRPLIVIAVVLLVTGAIGVARGNPLRFVLADVVPFAELGVLAWLTLTVVDTREKALVLVRIVALSLAATAIVRLVLYLQGPGAFGVESVTLGGSSRARLYQAYPYGWLLPFALACALAARRLLDRLCALGVALLCGLMVLLSFERGLWVFAAVATLGVVAFGLRRRPRVMVPVLATALAAFVLGGGLLGGGSGFKDPISLVRERLAGTSEQLAQRQGISHKRQDEATLLWRRVRDDEGAWPLGHGLGAEYVGPTGIREGEYAASFRKKHYSFNWFLAMAFRTGFVGLAVAVWLVLALAGFGLRLFRRGGSPLERGTGLALAGGVAGLALVAAVDPYLIAHPLASIQGATLAMAAFVARAGGRGAAAEDEATRVRRVYATYDEDPRVQGRRDPGNRANVLIDAERTEALDAALAESLAVPLAEAEVLDVGCGAGDELARLVARGADPSRCHGVDLLADRVARARKRIAGADLREGDARELPFADATMDVVVLKVVLSSVLDPAVSARIATEVDRVLRPGGLVLWYDNRFPSPFNREVRGVSRAELARLFPGYDAWLRNVTVVPPLVRRFGPATGRLYGLLRRVRPLLVRTAGVLVKPAAPAAPGAPARRLAGEARVPGARWLLAILGAAAAGLILALTRDYTFYRDDWLFLLTRRDWTADAFLEPHHEAWSTLPVLLYKLLFATAGAEAYWPYMLLVVVAHLGLAWVVFLLVRRRAGDVLALAAAAIVLFLGRGAENLIWAFQAGFVGALALGLLAVWLLDRRDPARRHVAGAALALTLALMCGEPGVAVAAALAAELVADRKRRRLLLVLIPPLAVFAAWYALYGRHGEGVDSLSELADNAAQLPGYAWLGLRASAAAAVGAPVGLGIVPLAGLTALVTAVAVRRGRPSARAIGAIAGLLAVFVLAALVHADLDAAEADQQRYRYAGAVFVLILAADALRELPWRGGPRAAIAIVAVVAVAWNVGYLFAFSEDRRDLLDAQTAELQTLSALRGAPDMRLDGPIDSQLLPGEVTPREYFAAAESLGSPVPDVGVAGLDALPPAARDRALVAAFGPSTQIFQARRFPRPRDCERRPRPTSDFVVPSGSLLVVRSPQRRLTTLFLWRGFGPDVDVSGELPLAGDRVRLPPVRDVGLAPRRAVAARLPALGPGLTWSVRWAGLPAGSDVCLEESP
jgi:ubiquinone/menaquinone biosynthesis C-methylase UbiE